MIFTRLYGNQPTENYPPLTMLGYPLKAATHKLKVFTYAAKYQDQKAYLSSVLWGFEVDEGKAPGAAWLLVVDDADIGKGAVLGEDLTQVPLRGVQAQAKHAQAAAGVRVSLDGHRGTDEWRLTYSKSTLNNACMHIQNLWVRCRIGFTFKTMSSHWSTCYPEVFGGRQWWPGG